MFSRLWELFMSQHHGSCIFLRTCLCLVSQSLTYTPAGLYLAKDSRRTFSRFGELSFCIAHFFWEVCPGNFSHLNLLECLCQPPQVSKIVKFFLDSFLCTAVWKLPSDESLGWGRAHFICFSSLRNPGLCCLLFNI